MQQIRKIAVAILLAAPGLAPGTANAMSGLEICGYSDQGTTAGTETTIFQLDLEMPGAMDGQHGILCTPVTLDPISTPAMSSTTISPDLYGFVIEQDLARAETKNGKISFAHAVRPDADTSGSAMPAFTPMGALTPPGRVLEAYLALLGTTLGTVFVGHRFAAG